MIKKYAKVDAYPNLIRDLDTNAIINTDSTESVNYDRNKRLRQKKDSEFNKVKSDIVELKSSVEEIKNLLKEIIDGK
jgi:hypothetical protein